MSAWLGDALLRHQRAADADEFERWDRVPSARARDRRRARRRRIPPRRERCVRSSVAYFVAREAVEEEPALDRRRRSCRRGARRARRALRRRCRQGRRRRRLRCVRTPIDGQIDAALLDGLRALHQHAAARSAACRAAPTAARRRGVSISSVPSALRPRARWPSQTTTPWAMSNAPMACGDLGGLGDVASSALAFGATRAPRAFGGASRSPITCFGADDVEAGALVFAEDGAQQRVVALRQRRHDGGQHGAWRRRRVRALRRRGAALGRSARRRRTPASRIASHARAHVRRGRCRRRDARSSAASAYGVMRATKYGRLRGGAVFGEHDGQFAAACDDAELAPAAIVSPAACRADARRRRG